MSGVSSYNTLKTLFLLLLFFQILLALLFDVLVERTQCRGSTLMTTAVHEIVCYSARGKGEGG